MDLSCKREAKNCTARLGFAFLFASYCLVAIFTSLPLQKTFRAQGSAPLTDLASAQGAQIALLRETTPTLPAKQNPQPVPVKWWQVHQDRELLQGQWWKRHIAETGRSPKTVEIAKVADGDAVNSDRLPKSARATKTLLVLKMPDRPKLALRMPPLVLKRVPTAIVEQHKKTVQAVRETLKEKRPAPLKEASVPVNVPVKKAPLQRATMDWRATTTHARLIPLKVSTARALFDKKPVKKIAYVANFDAKSLIEKTIEPAVIKHQAIEPTVHQCVADNIAGWSGVKLMEKHKDQLLRSDSEPRDVSKSLAASLAAKGFTAGSSIFLRIFKDKSVLQVWMKKGDRYALFHTYKICRWSGSFGPKLYEGDKQSPEGFYRVTRQLFNRPSWKWKDSFSIGYPNAYDKLHGRTGSLILVHGGCTSSGCFAMTNPVIKDLHELGQLARENGQKNFSVHVYPFKLTKANLKKYKNSPWSPFWNNLKEGYDLFEKTGLPPRVKVCNKRYVFASGDKERSGAGWSGKGCYGLEAFIPGWRPARRTASRRHGKRGRRAARSARRSGVRARCNFNRPSCRKWAALKSKSKSKAKTRRKSSKRRRVAKKTRSRSRTSAKRRATMRRARAIGRKRARKNSTNNKYP